jgi:trehalose-6-phosphate synthase
MNAAGRMTVTVDGKEVSITCIHIGVDIPRLDEIFSSSSNVTNEMKAWKQKFPEKIIVAGISYFFFV